MVETRFGKNQASGVNIALTYVQTDRQTDRETDRQTEKPREKRESETVFSDENDAL